MRFQIYINNRNYTKWEFKDVNNENIVDINSYDVLKTIQPLESKLFSRDIVEFDEDNKLYVLKSILKNTQTVAGVLIIENNKTFGRAKNRKLLYKCIPDDKYLPIFLVPFDIKLEFNKKLYNKYVVFRFDNWTNRQPEGRLVNTLGNVNDLDVFYEYQLYCKSLHISLTEFTNTTKKILNKVPHDVYVEEILKNPNYNIENRKRQRIITIDSPKSVDFDDALGIEPIINNDKQVGWCITIYIANVFLWLETLELWKTFSHRVSTIYLPDRKRPMLPTILSDTLCSLQENQLRFAFAMDINIDMEGNFIDELGITYKNVLINVHKNYSYEEKALFNESVYCKLMAATKLMDKNVNNSHELIAYWMIAMNASTGIHMLNNKVGIFRSVIMNTENEVEIKDASLSDETIRVIKHWNNISGHYIHYRDGAIINHQLVDMSSMAILHKKNSNSLKPYIHFTSPIRRLVDLLNQIIMFEQFNIVNEISLGAKQFLNEWICRLDYLNTSMRSIKKLQTDCNLLYNCIHNPDYLDLIHKGVVFDKVKRNNGSFNYTVYLEGLKLISRITTHFELEEYSHNNFKLYLFEGEDKVKKKIKLQLSI